MSNRYKGGFISGTPPTTSGTPYTGSAGGMWTASQVFQAKASGLWPVAGPSAPTSLSVVPFNASATVTFSGATVTAGKPAITSYTVTAFPGGRFVTGAASPLTVTGLTNNVLHTFTVSATNSDGTSIPSSGITETPMLFVPTAPTAISGRGENGQVAVTFSGATVPAGKPAITSYTVTASPGGATVTGAASPLTVTGLTNGDNYTFTVVATNADGNSPASITSAAVMPSSYIGKLFAWGDNTSGQLGDGTVISRPTPVQIGSGNAWLNVSSSSTTMATKTDGTLWTWGQNASGKVGDGTIINRSSPVQLGSGANWSKVASNAYGCLATKTDGTLWSWGPNNHGVLGAGTIISRSSPVQVGALTNWLNVADGCYRHTIATKTDGTLWSWGANDRGQLGQNISYQINRSSPTQVGTGTTWLNAAGGNYQIHAIKTDGTLWGCGFNIYPFLEVGDNTIISRSTLVQIGTGTTWSKVSDAGDTGAAIKTDGTLWTWGRNLSGQLGDGTTGDSTGKSSPVQIGALTNWSQVRMIGQTCRAIKSDGTLWHWGSGISTTPVQFGTGTNWVQISLNSALYGADIPGASVISSVEQTDTGKVTVSFTTPKLAFGSTTTWTATSSPGGLTASNTTGLPITVTGLSSGVPYTFTVRASTADGLAPNSVASSSVTLVGPTYVGRLWTWGSNNGNIGDGTVIRRSSPVQVGSGTTWSKIAGGSDQTFATKTDGTLWSWGYNFYGQLGDGTSGNANKSSPVQVGVLTTWSDAAPCHFHTLARKIDGTLWSWGYNSYGQLGHGTVISRSSPVQIGAGTTWLNVVGGYYHSIAHKTDGTLWSWGLNTSGQLGDGTIIHKSSPVQIGALTTWLNVAGGWYSTIATKTDGTLWTWGDNINGNLGDGTNISRSSPVQVGALTTWSKIAGGKCHVIATKTDGTLWSWGWNNIGEIGDGTNISRSSPVQVGVLTTWSKISGGRYTIATKTDGTLWLWGRNNYGQLGLGDITNRSSPTQVGTGTTWLNIAGGNYHGIAISK